MPGPYLWADEHVELEGDAMTHWDGCWNQGPEHYGCAVTRIRTLERDVKAWIDIAHGQRRQREGVEIERDRLREALEKIASSIHTSTGAIIQAGIARAALEGKP
jgi:hypothetical protein